LPWQAPAEEEVPMDCERASQNSQGSFWDTIGDSAAEKENIPRLSSRANAQGRAAPAPKASSHPHSNWHNQDSAHPETAARRERSTAVKGEKDMLSLQAKTRLKVSGQSSRPEPREASNGPELGAAGCCAVKEVLGGGSKGKSPLPAAIIGKGRLASTLPTCRPQKPAEGAVQVHSLLAVAPSSAPATRRVRSADDPTYAGSGAGEGGEGTGGENMEEAQLGAKQEAKTVVDLLVHQQKARRRIAEKKRKERQRLDEWEAQQEQARREKLEAKQGASAEAEQRRAAIYAINFLMHQQEWGAWRLFEQEQKEGAARPSSHAPASSSRPHSSQRAGKQDAPGAVMRANSAASSASTASLCEPLVEIGA
jgi:hypothetical protein